MRRRAFVTQACSLLALSCAPAIVRADPTLAPRPSQPAVSSAPLAAQPAPAVTGLPISSLEQAEAAYVQFASYLAKGSRPGTFTGRLANWPITGRVSSPFGPRWGGFHNGLDIAAALYTPVLAAAAGQVVSVGKPSLVYGDTATIVVIAHERGFATLYAHLNDERSPMVKVGERIAAGQQIAFNGTTGWSTGPHVHFMTIVDGRAVDPRQYLP